MNKVKVLAGVLIFSIVASVGFTGCKKKDDEYRLVKVESVSGSVTVERDSEKEALDAFEGMNLISKDVVSVGSNSDLELIVDSDKHLRAEENTVFELVATGDEDKGKVKISMSEGSALFEIENKLSKNSTFEVSTPNAVFSVRGTEFKVAYDKSSNETVLEVYKGVVAVDYENDADSEEVEAGEGKIITADSSKDYKIGEEATSNNGGDSSIIVDENGDAAWANVSNDDKAIERAYQGLVANMDEFIANSSSLKNEYLTKDYMIFDYNHDGRQELILYLLYRTEDSEGKSNDYRDVVYLYYDDASESIRIKGVVSNDLNDSHFYAERNGVLVRYSWRTSPYESYIYYVDVNEEGSLIYILDEAFDEIISNPEDLDMHPCPLYGEWEIPFIN